MQPTQNAKDFKRLFQNQLTDPLAELDVEDKADLARFLRRDVTEQRPEEVLEAIQASIHMRKLSRRGRLS